MAQTATALPGPDQPEPATHGPADLEPPILVDFFKKMLDELYDGVYFVDTRRRILYWNDGAERISGHAASEVVGSFCFDNILDHTDPTGCHLCQDRCPLVASIQTRSQHCKRVFLRHKNGGRVPVEVRTSPVTDDCGRVVGAVEIFRDAGVDLALESAYRSARELAERDPLTGLANRHSLTAFVTEQVMLCRHSGRRFSVIMVDLDHFKEINDSLGHPAGDTVLVGIARLLLSACRDTDLAGHYGGDEFLVLLPNTGLDFATAIAERIRAGIMDSSRSGNASLPGLSASIGVAETTPADSWDSLIARADAALYRAKHQGRNCVRS